MPFGKAISAGAGLLGGMSQASAIKKAAKTAQQTQRETLAQQRALFDTQRADQMPYMDAGKNALLDVTDLSGANGQEAGEAARQGFLASPGYEFQLQQVTV